MTRSLRPLFPPVFTALGSRPLIDDFSLRAARQQARQQPPGINSTFVLPTRQNPMWSGNNELGRRTPFAPDANNRQMILKLAEWGPPEFWTMALSLDYNPSIYDPVTTFFGLTAEIAFGSGGTVHLVEIDWKQGSSITLPMNAVNVTAIYSPGTNEGGASAPPSDLTLAANVSHGAVTSSCPTRSYFIENAGADDDPIVPVPPFAKTVTLLPNNTPSPITFFTNVADLVQFISGPNLATARIVSSHQRSEFRSYVGVAENIIGSPAWVPVPEGARFLAINNISGGGAFSGFWVQYRIGL